MIFPFAGLVLGALLGAFEARRKKGNRLDMAQWGGVGAVVGGLIGLFLLVFLVRGAS